MADVGSTELVQRSGIASQGTTAKEGTALNRKPTIVIPVALWPSGSFDTPGIPPIWTCPRLQNSLAVPQYLRSLPAHPQRLMRSQMPAGVAAKAKLLPPGGEDQPVDLGGRVARGEPSVRGSYVCIGVEEMVVAAISHRVVHPQAALDGPERYRSGDADDRDVLAVGAADTVDSAQGADAVRHK